MKASAALLILLPAAAAAADSQIVNEARSEHSNLRGGKTSSHSHKGHSLLEEFRQQRAHKKDIEDDADIVSIGVGANSVGPGKYSDPVDEGENPTRKSSEGHSAIFRTSRLSRGEMETRAHEMEAQLQQVKDGTLELNEKTIDRYQKFVDRYNELEKEIHALNHPEEKEQENANTSNDTTAGDTKKLTSAYSSGKAEYEKSIKEMQEKKEMEALNNLLTQKEKDATKTNNDLTVAETQEKETGKAAAVNTTSKYVYAADGTKQLKIYDDDEINQLPAKPEKINDLDLKGSATDDDDVPSNFEGLEEGRISSKSVAKASDPADEAENDDDIPPNFEGLKEGKITSKANDEASKDDVIDQSDDEAKDDKVLSNVLESDDGSGALDIVVQDGAKEEVEEDEEIGSPREGDKNEISLEVDMKNSLEKVKKLADVVSTTEETPEKNTGKEDTEQSEAYQRKLPMLRIQNKHKKSMKR